MIGLDTNVLARIVLADDAEQTRQALELLQICDESGEVVAISLSVILELEWVLRSAAKLDKTAITTLFKQLLETAPLHIENEAVLEHALYLYEGRGAKADFAECLFSAQYQSIGCRGMASFDKKAQTMPGVLHPAFAGVEAS
jgi:predicted nucleic-acid-binding protein